MADRLGMSSGGYKKLEYATRQLSVSKAKAIAERLGRPVSDVIGSSESTDAPTILPDDPDEIGHRAPSREEVAELVYRFLEWDSEHRDQMVQVLTLLCRMGSLSRGSASALIEKIQKEPKE